MSESNENYYYEIALTNRQVLVSFVVLLGCVLLAFGSGVWVGRMGQGQVLAAEAPTSGAPAEATSDLDDLEEFRFASDEPAEGLNKPDLSELRGEPASTPPAQTRPAQSQPAQSRPVQAPAQRPPQQQAAAPPPPPPSRDTTLAEDVGNDPPAQTRPQQAPPRQAQQTPPPPRQAPPPSPPPPRQAPPRQAPPPAADALPAGEGFVVQVFATREEAQAQKVQEQLRKAGFQAFISSVRVGSMDNYRVRVGPYAERDPAERAARQITNDFKLETWVTAASN